MRKLFIALVAAVTIAGSVLAVPGEAEARYWRGGAVAAGVVGGLAAGLLRPALPLGKAALVGWLRLAGSPRPGVLIQRVLI